MVRVAVPINNMEPTNTNIKDFKEGSHSEDAGITTMVNDINAVVSERAHEVDLSEQYRQSVHGTADQDIKSYLTRPRVLNSINWTTASTSPLITYEIPFDILASNIFAQKAQGFLGFRATAVVRLQVNATRFQQGRLILHYLPPNVADSDNPAVYSGWKGAMTQHPNVQLDAGTQTEATLKIPYATSFLGTELIGGFGKNGQVRLSIYSPLALTTGSSVAQITTWGYFEDVELFGPTAQSALIPQSGKNLSPSAKEVKATGPVSSLASTISSVGKELTKVPMLSSIAGPTAWFADLVGNTAKAFGFSKPTHVGEGNRTRLENAPYHNNCDGAELTNIMSLFPDASVASLPVGRTDVDELSLQFMATKKSYFTEFNWTTSNTAGTTLFTTDVYPQNYSVSHIDTGAGPSVGWIECTPLAFVGAFFAYWRGGITYTFKFPKTEFHSGRLVATFIPAKGYSAGAPNLVDGAYLMREIFDMRLGNEFTITVPYTSVSPYLSRTETMGRLYLQVLNELVAPDTVPSTVAVLVEVAGAPDIEFEAPVNNVNLQPYIPKTYTIQAGSVQLSNPTALTDETNYIGGGKCFNDGNTSSLYCIGERITSFRQLLKRRSRIWVAGPPVEKFSIDPFFRQFASFDNTTGLVEPTMYGDLYNTLASIYAFGRGGMRFFTWVLDTGGDATYWDAWYQWNPVDPYLAYDGASNVNQYNFCGSWITHKPDLSGIAEFQVPQYMPTHARKNVQKATSATYTGPDANPFRLKVDFNVTSIASDNFYVARAGADDIDLNLFVSIPPLVVLPHSS
jgi:hypothetical protein